MILVKIIVSHTNANYKHKNKCKNKVYKAPTKEYIIFLVR